MNYKNIKRFFDLISSIALLIILLPIYLIIIIVLKFTAEGEIFFIQERIGKANKPFGMIKFATMLKNSPNLSFGTTTVTNDPRVTRFGAFLRKTKINELPQIINVIKGDISVVGPRPLPINEYSKYSVEVINIISKNKPGITGIGSLIFRDEEGIIEKNQPLDPKFYYENVILPYKGKLETWYNENISFSTDVAILFLTFWSIIKSDSQLVFTIFKTLPPKPTELTIKGIQTLS
jgi:lipopolysaccharide/colanic/teichoic acid biosynthesis glycosyltransferase